MANLSSSADMTVENNDFEFDFSLCHSCYSYCSC